MTQTPDANTQTKFKYTITLSAPAKGGYKERFASVEDAQDAAAALLGCSVDEMVEVDSPDGGVIYCYASQADADADADGAYAVQYSEAL